MKKRPPPAPSRKNFDWWGGYATEVPLHDVTQLLPPLSKQKSHSQERLHNIVTPNKRDSIRSKVFAGGGVGFGGEGAFFRKQPSSPPPQISSSLQHNPGDQQRAVDEIQLAHKVPVLVEIKPLHGLVDKAAARQYKGNVSSPRNTGHPTSPQAQRFAMRTQTAGHQSLKTSSALALPRMFASVRFPAARSVSISGRL